ncbi:MAG: peptidoglycan bridge formation glycyltransferase FemA/FemB family protein [bacterium]
MQILEITDKKIWNDFIGAQECAQFLQSWEWGEFHKKMGRKVWRLAVVEKIPLYPPLQKGEREGAINRVSATGEGDNILIAAQIIKYELPFRQSYLYCPRGPQIVKSLKHALSFPNGVKACPELAEWVKSEGIFLLYKNLKELARQEKSIFLRFEPMEENELKVIKSKVYKVKGVQPENEWILDLEKTEDELLKEMHQKTRYNIRLAEKNGVRIRCADNDGAFEDFWRLISRTYSRKEIKTHTREYYKGILDIKDAVKLWIAEYKGKVIAGNIVSYFGDAAAYLHGGADYEARNLMSPYLLQWETIKDAKKNGCAYYDFGGISEVKDDWQGITKFKKGFGGFELTYGGTYDAPFKKARYGLYVAVKKVRTRG